MKDQLLNQRTLVIIKPDAVKRGLSGKIIQRFEATGLKIVAAKMLTPTSQQASTHYHKGDQKWVKGLGVKTLDTFKQLELDVTQYHTSADPVIIGQEVLEKLIKYLCSGPIILIVWQGPHAIEIIRKLRGVTTPLQAEPGTILAELSFDSQVIANMVGRVTLHNLVHASGSVEEAQREIKHWFTPDELYDYYNRADHSIML